MSGHAVQVNEATLMATRRGAIWWDTFSRWQAEGRIEYLTESIGGGVCRVVCDDRDHAMWLAQHMIAQGCPESAITVVRT